MRVLFDLGHPAHFHLFKNAISILKQEGHDIEIIARQKDCLGALLDKTGWTYNLIPRRRTGLAATGWQNMQTFKAAMGLAMRKRFDLLAGTSLVVGPVARLMGGTSLVFNEDDAREVPMFSRLAYPTAHYIVTPDSLKYEGHGKKHLMYAGFHELAYLYPSRFTPNARIREELVLGSGERYFLIRLVSLTAHHDIGHRGVSLEQAKTLIERLSKYGKVFISAERTPHKDLQPYLLPVSAEKIFDVLAFADMVIGDSQTMIAEAAVLGTPAVRCNTFAGRLSYLKQLEDEFGLTRGFLPQDFDRLLAYVGEQLSRPDLKQQWQEKRQAMLRRCIDLTDWILKLFYRLASERKT